MKTPDQELRDAVSGQLPTLRAWGLSCLLHAALVITLGWSYQDRAGLGTGQPEARGARISIVRAPAAPSQPPQSSASQPRDSTHDSPAPQIPSLPSASAVKELISSAIPAAGESGMAATDVPGLRDPMPARRAGIPLSAADTQTGVFGVVGTGSRFVYVFDRSGSMGSHLGRPLAAAKSELLRSLQDLQEVHQFQIVFYNEHPHVFNPRTGPPALIWGDPASKRLAERFVRAIDASGGTRHLEALHIALGMRPDAVFFLTDADEPQLTETELAQVREWNMSSAVHAIEFGYGPRHTTSNFMTRLADQNRGQHVYVDVTQWPNSMDGQ